MVHSEYSHHHRAALRCRSEQQQPRHPHAAVTVSAVPKPLLSGDTAPQNKSKVQQNKKSTSKEATNTTLSNEMCKLGQKLWILCISHRNEITINRKGREICPPQTEKTNFSYQTPYVEGG